MDIEQLPRGLSAADGTRAALHTGEKNFNTGKKFSFVRALTYLWCMWGVGIFEPAGVFLP